MKENKIEYDNKLIASSHVDFTSRHFVLLLKKDYLYELYLFSMNINMRFNRHWYRLYYKIRTRNHHHIYVTEYF